MAETNQWSYRSARGLVTALVVLFVVAILTDITSLGLDLAECQTLQDRINGMNPGDEARMGIALAQLAVGAFSMLLYVTTAVVFCCWIYRANANARALGARDLTITPGWSVGWFFIPIANLYKPFKSVKEIWNASDPDADHPTAEGVTPVAVTAWWGFWLLSNVSGQVSFRATMAANTAEEMLQANYLSILSTSFSLVLSVVAILMVRGMQTRQSKLYRVVRKRRKREQEQRALGRSQVQSPW